MEPQDVERRLTTILVADVVGYSRLMGLDEASTLSAITKHRDDLVDPKAVQYGGRIVKHMGDGTLMEFASVVDAVAFAVEVQCAMKERNAEVPEDRQIIYRIGINVGDIIVKGDDIYGDGVNVASRLEGLADPGGICIRRNVRNQVRDKLNLNFQDLGEIEVKNIARLVRVFHVILDEKAEALATPVLDVPSGPMHGRWPAIAAGLALSVVTVAGVVWWQPWVPKVEPASVERMVLPLPDKPSIAVLPFDNMSGDPQQEYLSDGISENIITGLSHFPEIFVIARQSSFSYKGMAVKVQQIAEELGVQYILEGSVQRAGDRLRVTAQLIDATTGRHLWAEQYDRQWSDVFALQDDITQHIIANISSFEGPMEAATRERARQKAPADLKAYDYLLLGRASYFVVTKEENAKARELFQKAIELDPNYSLGHAWLAWTHAVEYEFGWSDAPSLSADLALDHAQKALELDSAEALPHWVLASVLSIIGKQPKTALSEYDKALSLNPNNADLIAEYGWSLSLLGRAEEGVKAIEKAMRLNPRYPDWYGYGLMEALYTAKRYQDAIAIADKVKVRHLPTYLVLAGSYAQLGRMDDAQEAVSKVLAIKPDFSLSWWREIQKYARPEDAEHYLEGLRKAGLPE